MYHLLPVYLLINSPITSSLAFYWARKVHFFGPPRIIKCLKNLCLGIFLKCRKSFNGMLIGMLVSRCEIFSHLPTALHQLLIDRSDFGWIAIASYSLWTLLCRYTKFLDANGTIMPRCAGLPTGRCPRRVNNNTVVLTQGDLMICPSCDAIRFPTDVLDSNNRTTTVATMVIEESHKPGKAGRTNSSKTEQSANRDVATETCTRCQTPCR